MALTVSSAARAVNVIALTLTDSAPPIGVIASPLSAIAWLLSGVAAVLVMNWSAGY